MINFSVVVPLYNKERDIKQTLDSVLKQTYAGFEIIIIDDGSTDKSAEVVKKNLDKRIKLYTKKNEGVSRARNFGVSKASSNYIAFLDADDYWYPNHLENLSLLITKYPSQKWYATAYEKKRNKNLITPMNSPIMNRGKNWSGVVEDYFENCFIDCLTWTSAVCFKKSFFTNLGGFNSNFTHGEDTDLWIRAALVSPLIYSNRISAMHNLLGSNRSTLASNKSRRYINLDTFSTEELLRPSFKKYLDLNRYSYAIKHILSGDEQGKITEITTKIDLHNLNKKQRFLLKQNKKSLQLFFFFQKLSEKLGIRLSSF